MCLVKPGVGEIQKALCTLTEEHRSLCSCCSVQLHPQFLLAVLSQITVFSSPVGWDVVFQYVHAIQGCYSAALHCCCCSVSQCNNEVRCPAPSLLISSFLVDFYYCCVKELKRGPKLYPFSKDLVFQCQVVYLALGPYFQLDTGEAFCSPYSLS